MIDGEKIAAAMAAIAVGPDVEPGQCQRAMGRTGQKLLNDVGADGNAYWNNYSFASAYKALEAAQKAGTIYISDLSRVGEARAGSAVYFDFPTYGHVGIVTGPDRFVSITANRAGFIRDLGNGVFESSISGYAKSRAFRGVATTNGNRPALEGYPQLNPQPKPNQRVPKAPGARRRASKDNANSEYLSVPNYPGGSIQTPIGWANGAVVAGSPVWFGFADGRWSHSSAWTDAGTHDLADLNPPPAPVKHLVTFDLGDTGFTVEVLDGQKVTEPDIPAREGWTFDGWMLGTTAYDFSQPVTKALVLDARFTEIPPELEPEEPEEPAGPGEPDVDEPEEPQVPQLPVIDPKIENLDDAAVILADAVSPWLSSGARAKVYEWTQVGITAFGSVAGVATATTLLLGLESQIGSVASGIAIVSTALVSAAGFFAARLARKNTPKEAAKRLANQGEPLGIATLAKIKAE